METLTITKPIHISDSDIFNRLTQTDGTFYMGYTEDGIEEVHKHFSITASTFEESMYIMKIYIQNILFHKYQLFLSTLQFKTGKHQAQYKGTGWYDTEYKLILTQSDFNKGIYHIAGKNYALYFTEITGLRTRRL